jgi:hypothetical protein
MPILGSKRMPLRTMTDKKTFRLYWLTGETETVSGSTVADAMNKAGYGGGAVSALDFYKEGEESTYHWDAAKKNWAQNPEPADASN